MESELLQLIVVFVVGLVSGALIMLLWNKLSSGSASPSGLKQEYQDYQEQVETHFEETSKKFQDMTAQYQDLYKHLSVGATSLCRPDSVAAALADESQAQVKIESQVEVENKEQALEESEAASKTVAYDEKGVAGEPQVSAHSATDDSSESAVAVGTSENRKDSSPV
ncbi:MAG: uncharacterized membrane-anchored protein YhcB (DUF1043 family) [Arenicella sp.]|jgi:uncharacterized membrane-anchored protein YhcB (DUF1043 family)